MRILLDHCVPKSLIRSFPTHHVRTAAEMGWQDLRNGKLLAEAATAFDVLLTVDKNIKHEQNLATLPLAVIVLRAPKNTPDVLAGFASFVEVALGSIRSGQMLEVDMNGAVTVITSG